MELTKKLLEIENLLTDVEMDIEKVWAMCGALSQRHFEAVKDNMRLSRIENEIALDHSYRAIKALELIDKAVAQAFELAKQEVYPGRIQPDEASIEADVEAVADGDNMELARTAFDAMEKHLDRWKHEKDFDFIQADYFYSLGLMHGARRQRENDSKAE